MLTRRQALTGTTVALMSTTTTAALAAKPDNPDAALLADIAEFNALETQGWQLIKEAEQLHGVCAYMSHPDFAPTWSRIERRKTDLLAHIQVTPAATLQGVLDKLRFYMTIDELETLSDHSGVFGRIAASAFRDLERLAGTL